MMAALAKYRDDVAGTIATGGTGSAYTLSTYQTYSSLADGRIVAFTPHATNGDGPTINVDSLGAKPLRVQTGVALGAGSLIQGTPYVATYRLSSDEWMVHGFFATPSAIPIGGFIPYCGSSAPSSLFVLPYGQAISRSTYATLFSLISTTFGVGDGTTTFNVPDLRGRVVAGLDNMGGVSADRLTAQTGGVNGDTLGAVGGAETHALLAAQNAAHTHTGTTESDGAHTHDVKHTLAGDTSTSGGGQRVASISSGGSSTGSAAAISGGAHTHTFTTDSQGSGTAHNNVQPTIILPYIMRVI